MDTKNLLYVMPPFKPVASHMRASFIDLDVTIGSQPKQPIWLGRDAMGIVWVHFRDSFEKGKLTLDHYTDSGDQTLRSWFPVQTQVVSRKARLKMLTTIVEQVIHSSIPGVRDYCIPRVAIYREPDCSLTYHFEIIRAEDKEWIAGHIGNKERLLSPDILERGFLAPPKRIRFRKD